MKHMHRINRFTLAIGAAAALFAVSSAQAEDGEYVVLMKTLSNPFWGAMSQGVEDGAKEAGVKYFLQAAESDQAAEPQLNLCNTMLERKPVAMITAAINSTNLLPCLKQASDAGIPVVDLDANLDHDIAKKLNLTELNVQSCIAWIVHFLNLKSRQHLVLYASSAA